MKIRLATRGSALALAQADLVKNKLKSLKDDEGEDIEVELIKIKTKGDLDRSSRLQDIGGKGLFVRGIEEELLRGTADIAVHSAKDLPYEIKKGLVIAGIPKAASPEDVLITGNEEQLPGKDTLKPYVIGTGSPRRALELKRIFPNAVVKENRGNIETRLRKLKEGRFDAIVLAKAGIDRLHLDLSKFHTHVFDPMEFIPACCQGILAVECRTKDEKVLRLLKQIKDPETEERFRAERYVFRKMKADCSVAIGVYAGISEESMTITGMFRNRKHTVSGRRTDWKELGDELAGRLLKDEKL